MCKEEAWERDHALRRGHRESRTVQGSHVCIHFINLEPNINIGRNLLSQSGLSTAEANMGARFEAEICLSGKTYTIKLLALILVRSICGHQLQVT